MCTLFLLRGGIEPVLAFSREGTWQIGSSGIISCYVHYIEDDEGTYYDTPYFTVANAEKYKLCSYGDSIALGPDHCIHCAVEDGVSAWAPSTDPYYGYYGCANTACACLKDCPCTPRDCPVPIAPDKFRTNPQNVNGSSLNCANTCNPITAPCAPSYFNAAPTCSMVAASLDFTRESAAKPFDLIASDADYGDTVQVTGVRVVDAPGSGNLKSCVKISTVGGGSLYNLTVKPGSDNAADTSFTTHM
jgi:hypothetical protein